MRKPGVSVQSVRLLIVQHTRSKQYLSGIVNGQFRYSLTGTPTEEITEQHKQAAAALLSKK